jgi:hypothetical protein
MAIALSGMYTDAAIFVLLLPLHVVQAILNTFGAFGKRQLWVGCITILSWVLKNLLATPALSKTANSAVSEKEGAFSTILVEPALLPKSPFSAFALFAKGEEGGRSYAAIGG